MAKRGAAQRGCAGMLPARALCWRARQRGMLRCSEALAARFCWLAARALCYKAAAAICVAYGSLLYGEGYGGAAQQRAAGIGAASARQFFMALPALLPAITLLPAVAAVLPPGYAAASKRHWLLLPALRAALLTQRSFSVISALLFCCALWKFLPLPR